MLGHWGIHKDEQNTVATIKGLGGRMGKTSNYDRVITVLC